MRSFLVPVAFACALAGRVAALSIAVAGINGNLTASQFLDVPEPLKTQCTTQCNPANNAIQACGTDDACLCNNATVSAITACQQCMFNQLIAENIPMPDPRAGSSAALTAYATACAGVGQVVNTTQVTLSIPSNWDGPFGVGLNTGGTVVTVAVGGLLGFGAIMILSNM
ncbi:hypothetical protein GLOTRDRAFT_111010 [Gloeophyllum trabeum ATCC 11539]|uniref:Extracellular membrane protein CFEM domain-containing protein n=1 Tax=Gloeophyllum trabeum (strain ATCC 11539 / FP-39264 / Madison 617) TaxID=670483 RepID=S7RMW2_GLOTA|nr:uncharacterized protein GLOTRDRAFT_111010 [Gloeophyllum trabeum ATCC 11539]EPQ55805.1 hypothetical protein GLOTRDRAFT_111010 [Gloeophyllum trabeum ATCC 11539]